MVFPALFALTGGYAQWVTGYLYLFIIQGYASWLLFYKTGQPFYGYSATMALGAYTCVVLQRFIDASPFLGIFLGAFLSLLLAVTFYLAISRSRGFYTGMASFLLAILMPKLIEALYPITGGRSGVQIDSLNRLLGSTHYFLMVVLLTAATVSFVVWLTKTKLGQIWTLIAGNEDLAQAVGLNTFYFKLLAYAIAGLVSGLGGALYVHYASSISSVDINVFTSVSIFFIPLLGSKRSIYGPLIGALFIVLFPELFSSIERYVEILYGLSYILVMIFLPNGLIDDLGRLRKSLPYGNFIKNLRRSESKPMLEDK
jgi:branched-chain amino acid transport system permease protein